MDFDQELLRGSNLVAAKRSNTVLDPGPIFFGGIKFGFESGPDFFYRVKSGSSFFLRGQIKIRICSIFIPDPNLQ